MLLPKFDYHEPRSVDEATRLMGEIGRTAAVLAAGTDLFVNMKMGKTAPKRVVSLCRIEDLKGVKREQGSLTLGACVTASELKEQQVSYSAKYGTS
jgi:aerobic carbon-monoxide dehydrogenase medium subunit